MANRDSILNQLAEHRETLQRMGVRTLALFGSHARNDDLPDSDIDLLVELQNKTFDAYMDVKQYLEDLFQCSVDLVLADNVKPQLRESIEREAVHAAGL
jgi:predicted nucleotidyltransferase